MSGFVRWFILLLVGAACSPVFAQSAPNDVAAFSQSPAAFSGSLSPNGNYFAFVRRSGRGEQIVVFDIGAGRATAVQEAPYPERNFNWVVWKSDDRLLFSTTVRVRTPASALNTQRTGGEEYLLRRVVAMNRRGGDAVQMFEGQLRQLNWGFGSTVVIDDLPNEPNHILLAASDNQGVGVWRGDVRTGAVERVEGGTWDTISYATDGAGFPVIRTDLTADGYRYYRRESGTTDWIFFREARVAELTTNSPDFAVLGAGPAANQVYVRARASGGDRSALYLLDAASGEMGAPLFEAGDSDVHSIVVSRTDRRLLLACGFFQRLNCRAEGAPLQRRLNAIQSYFSSDATVRLLEISPNGSRWIVAVSGPREPGGYYLYDDNARSLSQLEPFYPNVAGEWLSPTTVVDYQARDGVNLWAYATARDAQGPRPMIIMPHGGPEARDYYGYDSLAQFLASRGYVVVQPHFRGSSGSGAAFADAGRGQWGRLMQDDLTDAVRHFIDAGIADPSRVCIVGASYGGYAALAGAAFTTGVYRCAISISGVSDLTEVLQGERLENGRNSIAYQYWRRSIGDPNRDRDMLVAYSPARHADQISVPVLLIHGDEDETVPIEQSLLMQRALTAAGHAPRFIRLAGSDHYWDNWSAENRLLMYREVERFLGEQLAAPR